MTIIGDSTLVYVDHDDKLVYNGKRMRRNKLYTVTWHNEAWGLMRTNDDNVLFMKFYPHRHDGVLDYPVTEPYRL